MGGDVLPAVIDEHVDPNEATMDFIRYLVDHTDTQLLN